MQTMKEGINTMLKRAFRFLFIIFTFVNIIPLRADTISMQWFNEDGTTYDTTTCTAGGDVILPTAPTKRGYTFMGWRTYTPIEYLKSTGMQYIDTGYMFDNVLNARIVLDASFDGDSNDWNGIFLGGSYYGGPTVAIASSDRQFAYTAGIGDQRTGVVANLKQRYVFDLNIPNSTYVVSDENNNVLVNIQSIVKQSRTGEATGFLFGYNGNPSSSGGAIKTRAMTIWSVQIYNRDTLVRDFIPVLDPNGVPCMLDKVSDQFFYNAGTGDFIAGPVINE